MSQKQGDIFKLCGCCESNGQNRSVMRFGTIPLVTYYIFYAEYDKMSPKVKVTNRLIRFRPKF